MLPASTAPSAPPAPTSVCNSSMNVMISPSESAISLSTALNRSSNSPRYFAPATIEPMSSAMTRLLRRPSGTSPSTMRRARPSTIAVLPTPGSPMSTGLFLVRRESTWMIRRISSSRPITGSILPWRAASVRSRPYFSSAWYCSSGLSLVTRCEPRTCRSASSTASRDTPTLRRRSPTPPATSVIASRTCSVERYSSSSCARSLSASSSTRNVSVDSCASRTVAPLTRGWRPSSSSTRRRSAARSTPIRSITPETTPSGWSSSARSRCADDTSVLPASRARVCAAPSASWVLRVNRLGSSGMYASFGSVRSGRHLLVSNRITVAERSGTNSRRYSR